MVRSSMPSAFPRGIALPSPYPIVVCLQCAQNKKIITRHGDEINKSIAALPVDFCPFPSFPNSYADAVNTSSSLHGFFFLRRTSSLYGRYITTFLLHRSLRVLGYPKMCAVLVPRYTALSRH